CRGAWSRRWRGALGRGCHALVTVASPMRAPAAARLAPTGREVGYPELHARVLVVGAPCGTAAAHQRTRGGGGVPCASCQEITGLRSTPIPSISASITSPGRR